VITVLRRRERVTSEQVADYAGVSRTTVSLVLNNVAGARISDETRARVRAAAQALGYVPDASAQALAQGRSRNLGFFMYQVTDQAFFDPQISTLMTSVSGIARESGYRVLVENITRPEQLDALMGMLRSNEVAGAITEHWFTDVPEADDRFPLVLLTDHPVDGYYCVCTDLMKGVRELLDHLIALGHRQIACIPYTSVKVSDSVRDRLAVFHEVMAHNAIDPSDCPIVAGHYRVETGYHAMQVILQHPQRPSAVYAMNDTMAYGAMRAIHDAGLRIPDDIAVVGFDDYRLSAWSIPTLTTVHIPWLEQGRLATEMLLQLIHGDVPENPHIELRTQLMIRESCGG
jgi:LacI family transcriptional regulator